MRKIIVVLLSVLITAGFWFGSQLTVAAKLKKVPVLVAAVDIPARTQIKPEMVKVVQLPKSGVPPGVATKKEDAVGKYTISNYGIPKNGFVFLSIVKSPEEMPDGSALLLKPGEEMVALSVDLTKYLGGNATSGQEVNLWFMAKDPHDKTPVVGKLFERVRIVGARTQKAMEINTAGPSEQEKKKSSSDQSNLAKVILIAIPRDQVKYFFAAQAIGQIFPTAPDEGYTGQEGEATGVITNALDARKWLESRVITG